MKLNLNVLLRIGLVAGLTGAIPSVLADSVAADCDPAEVGYVASFKVKPGNETAFEKALSDLAVAVNKVEQGVKLYAPYRGVEGRYYMMERYTDLAAREAHGTHPEVTALFPAIGPHLAAEPDVQPVSVICP